MSTRSSARRAEAIMVVLRSHYLDAKDGVLGDVFIEAIARYLRSPDATFECLLTSSGLDRLKPGIDNKTLRVADYAMHPSPERTARIAGINAELRAL